MVCSALPPQPSAGQPHTPTDPQQLGRRCWGSLCQPCIRQCGRRRERRLQQDVRLQRPQRPRGIGLWTPPLVFGWWAAGTSLPPHATPTAQQDDGVTGRDQVMLTFSQLMPFHKILIAFHFSIPGLPSQCKTACCWHHSVWSTTFLFQTTFSN